MGCSFIDPLADSRWAALVERHPRASIFHTTGWLAALRRAYGYRPVVCTSSAPGEPLRDGVVFCEVKSWLTGRRLVSLPFSDHCEPLVESGRDLEELLRCLEAYRKEGGWKHIELRPVGDGIRSVLEGAWPGAFEPSRRFCLHTLDLEAREDTLLHSFHKSSIQQRIHRAGRDGITWECGRSAEMLEELHRLMLLTRRRHGFPPQPKAWFRNLIGSLGAAIEILLARYRGRAVASIVTLRFRDVLTFKYGCSDAAFHKHGAVPFLLWKAIQLAKMQDVRTFDLGRSDLTDQGLIQFKDRWAARRNLMAYWKYPATENGLVSERRKLDLGRQLFRRLPDPLLPTAGVMLYRHIG